MKTKYIFSLLIATSLLVSSCKKEDETTTESSDAPKEIIMPRVQSLPMGTDAGTAAVQQNPATIQNGTIQQQTLPAQAAPVKVAAGMNPSHGQPGHRCDIAVGAPLNSPVKAPATSTPAANNSAPYTITQTPTNPATITPATNGSTPALLNPATTTTAPGMNPPHGQDGHRCDIAVGAALPKS
jgi:hypothetical protein